jgi:hypothetical protein
MSSRSIVYRVASAFALALSLSACEQATAPATPPSTRTSGVRPPATVHGQWVQAGGDTLIDVFTVPAGTTASFTEDFGDGSAVTFANGIASICDPASSSYGVGTWDTPCEPATRSITFTVRYWHEPSGLPHVDFSPSVRFVPGAQGVTLYMHSPSASRVWWSQIRYCPTADFSVGACVDESSTDPSLATLTDPTTGYLYRRIKHFSGYNVVAD